MSGNFEIQMWQTGNMYPIKYWIGCFARFLFTDFFCIDQPESMLVEKRFPVFCEFIMVLIPAVAMYLSRLNCCGFLFFFFFFFFLNTVWEWTYCNGGLKNFDIFHFCKVERNTYWNVVIPLRGIYPPCKSKVTIASEILICRCRKLFLFNFMISKDKRILLCCIKSNMSVS